MTDAASKYPDDFWQKLVGRRVKVDLVSGGTLRGELVSKAEEEVIVQDDTGRLVPISKAEVKNLFAETFEEVWKRRIERWKGLTVAVIGAVFAVLGILGVQIYGVKSSADTANTNSEKAKTSADAAKANSADAKVSAIATAEGVKTATSTVAEIGSKTTELRDNVVLLQSRQARLDANDVKAVEDKRMFVLFNKTSRWAFDDHEFWDAYFACMYAANGKTPPPLPKEPTFSRNEDAWNKVAIELGARIRWADDKVRAHCAEFAEKNAKASATTDERDDENKFDLAKARAALSGH